MIVQGNQRWRLRKSIFRRPDEQIRRGDYDVVPLVGIKQAKQFVIEHHYAATMPTSRFRFGLFRHDELVGVANFGVPVNDRTITNVLNCDALAGVELNRFVLLDEVPGNGETFLLGRCFAHLRKEGLAGVVSFSDPCPRTSLDGATIFPGHVGTIYQAGNAKYLGRGCASNLLLLPDGRSFNTRIFSKVRNQESGWESGVRQLERYRADASLPWRAEAMYGPAWPLRRQMWRAWVVRWVAMLTRVVKHPGNHKYAWTFRKTKLFSLPYPKAIESKELLS
jgi:hypothetical protein